MGAFPDKKKGEKQEENTPLFTKHTVYQNCKQKFKFAKLPLYNNMPNG